MKDYYKILELNRDADADEIRTAFRKLALKYHPDHNEHPNANEQFIEINQAYNILSNYELRVAYDAAWYEYTHPRIRQQVYKYTDQVYTPARTGSPQRQGKWYKRGRQYHPHTYKPQSLYRSKIASIASLAFVCILFLDYFLPELRYTDDQLMVLNGRGTFILIVDDCEFPISYETSPHMFEQCEQYEILRTPIFRQNLVFYAHSPKKKYTLMPYYSIYKEYFFFPFGMLIASLAGLLWPKEHESVVAGALVSIIIWVFTLLFMYI